MKGTRRYYKDFGKASEEKVFGGDRELKNVPSRENSNSISYEMVESILLLEIDARLKSYVKQPVSESI